MSTYRMACNPHDYDSHTGVCSVPFWVVDDGGILPPLAIDQAFLIGSSIIGVWSLGFGFKILRKYLMR